MKIIAKAIIVTLLVSVNAHAEAPKTLESRIVELEKQVQDLTKELIEAKAIIRKISTILKDSNFNGDLSSVMLCDKRRLKLTTQLDKLRSFGLKESHPDFQSVKATLMELENKCAALATP